MTTVCIVQPYVPAYRVDFFERLIGRLADSGVTCFVAASRPHGVQAGRGDSRTRGWIVDYSPRRISLGGRTLDLGGARATWSAADAVVVGLQGTALDSYAAILDSRQRGLRAGVWGHVRSYVNKANVLDRQLEKWQARRAARVFAYTPTGAIEAIEMGVDPSRVTTLMNTLDVSRSLESYSESIQTGASNRFADKLGLVPGKTLLYLGGLDASKRIDLLAAALEVLWNRDPTIRLLVGGLGGHTSLLDRAAERGQVRLLGYADDRAVGLYASVSDAIVMPGRIGLVAVQALALGLPIITTSFSFHAPEREYLSDGSSVFVSPPDAVTFADEIERVLLERRRVEPGSWDYPHIDQMVERYSAGVVQMLSE